MTRPAKLDAPTAAPTPTVTTTMAAAESFKSAVNQVRNILRGPGAHITGMDSMRHICLYLVSRYMTRARVGEFGVPQELAWESLLETALTKNGGAQKAKDLFFHKDADDCLVFHFDRLFGTEKFTFDVKSAETHKEILEVLNKVDLQAVDSHMDVLGLVYELHLNTGAAAARDLGQFFTDRAICEYMAALCKPGFKAPGVPETVCDPTMGTGGLLTAYVKYFKSHHAATPVDWSVQQQQIYGCDTDPKVAGFARLNMFMETGGHRPQNMQTHDSLYGDLPRKETGFDVILANMPFGVKGIKFTDCCERVKALKLNGTKSEPLFLQLMMVALARGGRCAVVVPDGVLVNTSKCHNGTRKYLLDHFELRRVIKMDGQFFMNTGIKPSILFFENTGRPTENVEFWNVVRSASGEITETMTLSVPRAQIDNACSLDMRRYQESDAPAANPAGFPMVRLGDILTGVKGATLTLEKAIPGSFPLYSASVDIKTHVEANFNDEETIIQACVGSNLVNCIHYVNTPFSATGNLWVLRKTDTVHDVSLKFVYYWLLLTKAVLNKVNVSVLPKLNKREFDEITLPLPPRPIQDEIVATLDRIYAPGTTELADTLKLTSRAMDLVLAAPGGATLEPIVEAQRLIRKSAQMVADVKAQMVADVKAQMVAIVRASTATGEDKIISEVAALKYGFPFSSSSYTTEGLAVVKHNNISDGFVSRSSRQDYIQPTAQIADFVLSPGDIVISMDFDCGKIGKIVEEGWVLNQRVCLARTSNPAIVSQAYLYWLLRYGGFYEKMQSVQTGTTIKHISGKEIDKVSLKVPSPTIQTAVVARLDALQSQLTALETLQRQSEDNARFILESYLTPAAPAAEE